MDRPARESNEDALAERLRRLKRHGCVPLVTGDVDGEVRAEATRRLLGEALEPRTRVLVLTEPGSTAVEDRLPAGLSPPDDAVRVVDGRDLDTPVADSASDATGDPTAVADGRGLRDAVLAELDSLDHAALDESELRLAFDSFDPRGPLDDGTVRLLRLVTAIVRGVRGMGHVHYPVADDDDRVAAIDPLFDARIELRRRGTLCPEQRWHLPDCGTSEWVRI